MATETLKYLWEFPGGLAYKGSGIVTAVVRVQSLTQEILHAAGVAKNKQKNLSMFQVQILGYGLIVLGTSKTSLKKSLWLLL